MYVPRQFEQTDNTAIDSLLDAYPLALLIVSVDGEPVVTHVPVVTTTSDEGSRVCEFHLAKPNPMVKALNGTTSALLVFTGPNAYISPDWYGTENQVPTWNYAAIQITGTPAVVDDDDLVSLLAALSAQGEKRLAPKTPWVADKMDQTLFGQMRKAIVGYRMPVDNLDAKFKMNQNRKPAERAGVRDALDALGTDAHGAVREHVPE